MKRGKYHRGKEGKEEKTDGKDIIDWVKKQRNGWEKKRK